MSQAKVWDMKAPVYLPSLALGASGLAFAMMLLGQRVGFREPRVVWLLAVAAATSAYYRSFWGPLGVLALTAILLSPLLESRLLDVPVDESLQFSDFVLTACLVAYLAGHYRYLRARELAEPASSQRRWIPFSPKISAAMNHVAVRDRMESEVDAILRFVAMLPFWPVVAFVSYHLLMRIAGLLATMDFPELLLFPLAAVWLMGSSIVIALVAYRTARLRRLSLPEAELVLQEILHDELRGEFRMHAKQGRQ
ncbi:MAG: hypothetical protein U1D30_03885 [Planctomycetota bacterium]